MGDSKFTSSRTFLILIHTISWLIVFSIPTILQAVNGEEIHAEKFIRPTFIVFHLVVVALFYLNAFLLVPKILYKKRTYVYILSAILLIVAVSFLVIGTSELFPFHTQHERASHDGDDHGHHLRELFFFVFFTEIVVAAVSTSYRIIRDRGKTEKLLQDREHEHLKSELTFLRSQISPHFIFNVLNNIVSLSRKRSDMVEPVVIKLSHLMRYMLYESDDDKVMVEKEIEYLQSYIDLQMLRFGDDVKLNMDIKKNDISGSIEPMLLIPFVENAFKHGVVMIDKPEIDIQLYSSENELFFTVKNKFNDKVKEEKDKNSGIGLNNVRRRLNLLYKDNHKLAVQKKGDWFFVELTLKLK